MLYDTVLFTFECERALLNAFLCTLCAVVRCFTLLGLGLMWIPLLSLVNVTPPKLLLISVMCGPVLISAIVYRVSVLVFLWGFKLTFFFSESAFLYALLKKTQFFS